MATSGGYQESLIWTTLPNGYDGELLQLSVFLAPQLSVISPTSPDNVTLSDYADFANWPQTLANHAPSFTVTFAEGATTVTESATIVTAATPGGITGPAAWSALFTPTTTPVTPWTFQDFTTWATSTFSTSDLQSAMADIYALFASAYPTNPMIVQATPTFTGQPVADLPDPSWGPVQTDDTTTLLWNVFQELATPVDVLADLAAFHTPLPDQTGNAPATPVFDFHQSISSLNHFPLVQRLLGIAFDLTVPVPRGIAYGTVKVSVTPTWTSTAAPAPINLSPITMTTYSASEFQPAPQGTDYANRMLALNDASRFSITDVDLDLAGDRLLSFCASLSFLEDAQQNAGGRNDTRYGGFAPGSAAVTLPALRTSGPQLLWNGYLNSSLTGFGALLSAQASLNSEYQTWLEDRSTNPVPVLYAENVVRGLRFDIYTSSDASPQWLSLHGRSGTYLFGADGGSQVGFDAVDEGFTIPSASTPAGTSTPSESFRVHESVVRWHGWGLSAPRPGGKLSNSGDNGVDPEVANTPPAPSNSSPSAPQVGATFTNPTSATATTSLYPKLRFGNSYMMRARAVDLAGNSLPYSSSDATTATVFTHYRYQPVGPPMMAGVAPFGIGEGTWVMVLLDDQVATPTPNGRWLFPPKVSELVAEEHGMLDGFSFGNPPNPADPPAGDSATYALLCNLDNTDLIGVTDTPYDYTATPIAQSDDANGVPYFTGSPMPWTPWFSDPFSFGPALVGLPGLSPWSAQWNGTWPAADPWLLQLVTGDSASTLVTNPTNSTPGLVQVALPPAATQLVRVSSALPAAGLDAMGVWQWINELGTPPALDVATGGQVWSLSPYGVLRLVHAVRLPLVAPTFQSPESSRTAGSVSVDITDLEFLVDAASTGTLDISATWVDIEDDPADAQLGLATSSGHAFKLSVADPNPTTPDAQPLTLFETPEPFSFGPAGPSPYSQTTHAESATHHVGDTKHHLVEYTATGTSRFADMFTATVTRTATVGTPFDVSTAALGIDPTSVVVVDTTSNTEFVQGTDYTVKASPPQITVLATASHPSGTVDLAVTYRPVTTRAGHPAPVHVLSSAPPKAPVINQIVPAWQLVGPAGSLSTGIDLARTGGFLRVYLDRPWFSSGDGELLGVVTTVTTEDNAYVSTFPARTQVQRWVTMMGIDPINYYDESDTPWPVIPTHFEHLALVPDVPYRPPYTSPPQVYLAEDQAALYQVWPYDVNFDAGSGRWYADIAPRPGITQEGTYAPPPGYFIRLALCRFQPYSTYEADGPGALGPLEVSPVALAVFAQPVPDRSVSVTANTSDSTHKSVLVAVSGPGYQGWRPPVFQVQQANDVDQYDENNPDAPSSPYIYGSTGMVKTKSTSTMAVEVQTLNATFVAAGLTGDLAWETVGAPQTLYPTFPGNSLVTWGKKNSSGKPGVVTLPDATTSSTKMRLRISEIDYLPGDTAPSTVSTAYRRPFVCVIPIN